MIIVTNEGNFGSFRDIQIHMKIEKLNLIEIISVHYWGIPVLAKGFYSPSQIEFILKGDLENELP